MIIRLGKNYENCCLCGNEKIYIKYPKYDPNFNIILRKMEKHLIIPKDFNSFNYCSNCYGTIIVLSEEAAMMINKNLRFSLRKTD